MPFWRRQEIENACELTASDNFIQIPYDAYIYIYLTYKTSE